jgi:diguanylate cyclase (GGDEF)-like protein
MVEWLISASPKQSLRMKRHLAALAAVLVFTLACFYLQSKGMFMTSGFKLWQILLIFWLGLLVFTLLLRSGLNERLSDPSMTLLQMLWVTLFLLIITYHLNDWRGIVMMSFFAILSFGYFRLNFIQFIYIAGFAIFGHLFVILYIYINEPLRIHIDAELVRFFGFTITCLVMVYTGTAVSKLREEFRIRNLELADALELNTRLATSDDLTGLFTRRYLMDILAKQKALSERDDSDFVICFADLDHFKTINDTYGHHVGDQVLISFSKILRASIREIDYASRFGGEEFVVLLVKTDIDQAVAIAERIRQGIEQFNFNDIAPGLHVTTSIGLANYKEYKSIQETLVTADNRMYHAKDEGRNKIVYA